MREERKRNAKAILAMFWMIGFAACGAVMVVDDGSHSHGEADVKVVSSSVASGTAGEIAASVMLLDEVADCAVVPVDGSGELYRLTVWVNDKQDGGTERAVDSVEEWLREKFPSYSIDVTAVKV